MLRAKEGAIPPGGWHYLQKTPLGEVRLDGADKIATIDAITQFRINNSITLGSPEDDLDNFICSQWPHFCGSASILGEPYVQEYSEPKNFREVVTGWLANKYSQTGKAALVDEETAEERAQICNTCPQNREWKIGCPPCVTNAERIALMVAQNHKTETKVMGCAIAGHDNATAVHLPEPLLRHRNRYTEELQSDAPHCWMLRLNNG